MNFSTSSLSSVSTKAKKTWAAEEDALLIELTKRHGIHNWVLIAEGLENRSGKQCRERYHNHLQPNIRKGEWTEEEDKLIVELQSKYGNQWAKITKMLPGRTDNAVKNRWHAAMRSVSKSSYIAQGQTTQLANNDRRHHPLVPFLSFQLNENSENSLVCDLQWTTHEHSHSHEPNLTDRSSVPSDNPTPRDLIGSARESPRFEMFFQNIADESTEELFSTVSDFSSPESQNDVDFDFNFDFAECKDNECWFEADNGYSFDQPNLNANSSRVKDEIEWESETFRKILETLEISPRQTPRSPRPDMSKRLRVNQSGVFPQELVCD